jgi:hypothetical protein
MPSADAAALADALRDGGHEEPAFHLYEVAADAIVQRSPAAVVDLAAAMVRAGRERQGRELVHRAVRACTGATAGAETVEALRHAGLPAEPAMDLLAGRLPDHELLALADLLRAGRTPGDALAVLQLAAAGRPAASTIGYLTHLHEEGRPIDANRLLEQRGPALSGADLAAVAVAAAAAGPDVAVRRLLAAAAAGEPDRVAALIAGLRRAPGGADLARHTGAAVAKRYVAEVAEVAVRLIGHDETEAAGDLLRARQPQLFTDPPAGLDALLHGRRAMFRSDGLVAGIADVVVAVVCVDRGVDADGFVAAFLADDRTFRWNLAERLVRAPVRTAAAFFARLSPQVRSGCHRDYATVAARLRPPDLLPMFTAVRDLMPGHVLFDFLAAAGAQGSVDDIMSFVDDLVACGTAAEQFRPLLRGPAAPASYFLAAWVAAEHPHLIGALPFPLPVPLPTATRLAALQCIRESIGDELEAPDALMFSDQAAEMPVLTWPLAHGSLLFTDRAVHHLVAGGSVLAYDDLPYVQLRSTGRFDLRVVVQSDGAATVHDWRLAPAGFMSGRAALTAERLAEALRRARAAVNEVLTLRTGERPPIP